MLRFSKDRNFLSTTVAFINVFCNGVSSVQPVLLAPGELVSVV
jgi:hypothetical protein